MLHRLLATVLFAFMFIGCSKQLNRKRCRILTVAGIRRSDIVAGFEQQYKVRVEVTYVNTDDELWARASADGGRQFDLAAVNTAELQRFVKARLNQPVRVENIPNSQHQLQRFQHHRESIRPGARGECVCDSLHVFDHGTHLRPEKRRIRRRPPWRLSGIRIIAARCWPATAAIIS